MTTGAQPALLEGYTGQLSHPSSPFPSFRRAHRPSAWWAPRFPLSRGRCLPHQRSLPLQKFDRAPVEQHERLSRVPVKAVLHQGVAHRFG